MFSSTSESRSMKVGFCGSGRMSISTSVSTSMRAGFRGSGAELDIGSHSRGARVGRMLRVGLGLGLSIGYVGLLVFRGGVYRRLCVGAESRSFLWFSRGGDGILSGDDENKSRPVAGRRRGSPAAVARPSGFLCGIASGVLDSSIGSSSAGTRRVAGCLTGE